MPTRFWELGAGYLAYLAVGEGLRSWNWRHRMVAWIAAIGLVSVLFIPVELEREVTVLAVICSAVLIAALGPGTSLYRVLSWSPVVWLGLISYSLYLWHWSVLSISRWTIGVNEWTAPIQLTLMIGLAALSYTYVELPLRRRSWSSSPLITVGYGLSLSAAACLMLVILLKPLRGSLYTGQPALLAQKGVETLATERRIGGRLLWPARECILSSNDDVGKVVDPKRCLLAGQRAPSERLFVVIGNSFSAAEVELLDVLREKKLGAVMVTSSWGASPVPEIPNHTQWAAANEYYWNTVFPSLLKELRRGDFLVMIDDVADFTPQQRRGPDKQRLRLLVAGLTRMVKQMDKRGINVIFQTANPYIRDAKCSPDMALMQWFNLSEQTKCTYFSRYDTMRRRKPLTAVLSALEHAHPNFHVLDLLPVLCPGTICKMYDERGVFLYRDIWSHPSVEADELAQPILVELVERITATSGFIGAPSTADKEEPAHSTP